MNDNNKGINFKHFHIENGRSFKKIDIPLENQGIVLIQGDNGVGKSSIWDLFEAVLYGSTPNEHKKDELTKNEEDAIYTICFEKNEEIFNVSLKRKKGKWAYEIKKGSTPITEHTYNDAVKSISKLVGLTKAEFEGSVHLTQDTQHILIKSELAERKKYISNFFGIDDRYDQIHAAAKQEVDKMSEQIAKLAGLSHTKQMLETELTNIEVKDIDELQNSINTLQKQYDKQVTKLEATNKSLLVWQDYEKYFEDANKVIDPDKEILNLETIIIDNKGKCNHIETIRSRNEQAYKVNYAIDRLENTLKEISITLPGIEADTLDVSEYEKELQLLYNIRSQNDSVSNLRKEIKSLPSVEEISITNIEKELLNLQIAYQTHAKNKQAKEKGICTECGSKFTKQDVQKEIALLTELRENIDLINEDYTIVKNRNVKVKRRKLLEEHLAKIPAFSDDNLSRITYLERYVPLKKEYVETMSGLKILNRMEIAEEVDINDIPRIAQEIKQHEELIQELKKCQIAKKLLPVKPKENEKSLLKLKSTLHNEILNLKTSIQTNTQMLGEYKNSNATQQRLTASLTEIDKKLDKLEDLKKEEFFWSKMVDAYGPKGLRIQQLEKMMDLIIHQLPVYCSVLFKEKRLNFKHKVDPNNVKILACREEIDEENKESIKFQHDISSFSGGEKDLMSTSFVLTLSDCVPIQKKANLLILDEVDAQLDEDAKFRYTNQLLPMLRKKHGTIFVISHSKEVQTANIYDQVWEIQKVNHNSTLKITKTNQQFGAE